LIAIIHDTENEAGIGNVCKPICKKSLAGTNYLENESNVYGEECKAKNERPPSLLPCFPKQPHNSCDCDRTDIDIPWKCCRIWIKWRDTEWHEEFDEIY
jgi:hypothetical protein